MEYATTRVMLDADDFRTQRRRIVDAPAGTVTAYKYASSVPALEIKAGRSELIILPFRGQQIWRYAVDGENLTMRTTFDEPAASDSFGETYGAFLVHCGLTGIGAPGEGDRHAHHGELPSIANNEVTITSGEDGGEAYLGVESTYEYRLSHGFAYRVKMELKAFSERTTVPVKVTVTNLRSDPFDYAYLCHVNWKLEDLVALEQSVAKNEKNFVLAPHPGQTEKTAALLAEYAQNPDRSDRIEIAEEISPEYCAVLTPSATSTGKAEFLGLRGDGTAMWVAFDPKQLPRTVRWMSNTGDEQAAGFCLPSTGHHFGRARNQEDGLLQRLGGGESSEIEVTFGKLNKDEAEQAAARIEAAI